MISIEEMIKIAEGIGGPFRKPPPEVRMTDLMPEGEPGTIMSMPVPGTSQEYRDILFINPFAYAKGLIYLNRGAGIHLYAACARQEIRKMVDEANRRLTEKYS